MRDHCSQQPLNMLQCNPYGQLCPVNFRPLKVLVFATDKLRLFLVVSGNIIERIGEMKPFFFTFH